MQEDDALHLVLGRNLALETLQALIQQAQRLVWFKVTHFDERQRVAQEEDQIHDLGFRVGNELGEIERLLYPTPCRFVVALLAWVYAREHDRHRVGAMRAQRRLIGESLDFSTVDLDFVQTIEQEQREEDVSTERSVLGRCSSTSAEPRRARFRHAS